MRLIQARRFRLYPTPAQEEFFRRTAGCCRVVWNLALEQRQTYGRRGRFISFRGQAAELKDLRREVEWLAEAPSHCLQQALRDLDKAFARFFSGQAGFPRFKSKHRGEDSFRFPDPGQFEVGPDFIDLPKVGKVRMRNMTASAAGTVEDPGVNVKAKAGLNRAMLDVAPGTVRRMLEYKVKRHGGKLVAVNPAYTSQTCSCCGRHPKDSPETAQLPHGRVSRDRFVCPLCSFACDADLNAARNILARGKLAINDNVDDLVVTAGGSPVAACGALGTGRAKKQERKKRQPSGLPKAA